MTTDRDTRRTTTKRYIARVIACMFLCTLACRRAPPGQTAAGDGPAPAAPENLLAVMVFPHPENTWQAVLTAFEESGLALAQALPTVASGWLALPTEASDQLDTTAAIVGALTLVNDTPQPVVAVRLKDSAKLVDLATRPGGGFTKRQQPGDTLIELASATPSRIQLAVADRYLVMATNLAAVRGAIPFVTRNLSARAQPSEDLVVSAPHAALAGPIRSALEHWWISWRQEREAQDLAMRKAHGGSAPDFGDPAQALADIDARAKRFWDILSDLREANLRVTLAPVGELPNLHLELAAKGDTTSGPVALEAAALTVGDGEPLLSLPATIAAALLVYDSRSTREEGASEKVASISKVLGGRLEPSDQPMLEAALHGWARARGDWLTVGLLNESGRRTGVWRSAVANRDDMQRAISSVLRLVEIRAIAEPLSAWIGELRLSGFGDPSATSNQTVHVVRRPPKLRRRPLEAPASPNAFDLVWSVTDDRATGAIGDDARAAHDALQRRSGKALRVHPRLLQALTRRGRATSLAAFADLARLGLRSGESTVVLTYGKVTPDASDETSLTLDLPPGLLLDHASALPKLLQP